jgi:hypothetical protein
MHHPFRQEARALSEPEQAQEPDYVQVVHRSTSVDTSGEVADHADYLARRYVFGDEYESVSAISLCTFSYCYDDDVAEQVALRLRRDHNVPAGCYPH